MPTKKLFLLFISIFILFGCSVNEDGTLRDSSGDVLSASPKEILEAQHTLLNDQIPKNLPASAEGGVLFDGKVNSVQIIPPGVYCTTFNVHKVLYGDIPNPKSITIYSPLPEKTGVDFKEGKKYRVFAVFINEAYRTWDWLGTVKLEEQK